MITSEIIGTGSYAPVKVVTNKELEKTVDTSDEWIIKNLGIRERRIAEGECTSDMAAKAAKEALRKADISPEEIELIIVATATPDRLAPSTACIVQEKINAFNSFAFDISAVCSGFLYALSIADQYIKSGQCQKVLIVGADTFSKITDWNRRDCVFFGDGAGAAVLSSRSDAKKGFLASQLKSDGRGKLHFTIPGGGSETPTSKHTLEQNLHTFRMNGKEVYNTATRVLPEIINNCLKTAKMKIEDIDLMIPHQPSIRILKKTCEIINLPEEKLMHNMSKYANTSGGTIPILLDETIETGRIASDCIILFAAVGSGWTYGASIFKW